MSWKSVADLIAHHPGAPVAILGAPMEAGSVTPGRCDLAPETVRKALRRVSTFSLDFDIDVAVCDLGDVPVAGQMPADGFRPIRDAVAQAVERHELTIVIGGNNAVTRPAAHALGVHLEKVGLITLDAHYDMRETDAGPRNGNPVRCLLEDGLPGRNICQIGLAPFANTMKMSCDALIADSRAFTINDVQAFGISHVLDEALARLSHVERIIVDFDIDVIDRSQCPGAPGARPGGMNVVDFFQAARSLATEPRVAVVDLTEFDPSLDVSDITALTAARWTCEILLGFSLRSQQ